MKFGNIALITTGLTFLFVITALITRPGEWSVLTIFTLCLIILIVSIYAIIKEKQKDSAIAAILLSVLIAFITLIFAFSTPGHFVPNEYQNKVSCIELGGICTPDNCGEKMPLVSKDGEKGYCRNESEECCSII